MKLTDNISYEELGIFGEGKEIVENYQTLAISCLQPIRNHYNSPIIFTDGYRDEAHNKRVGGKPDSWHLALDGKAAADFKVAGQTVEDVFDWIRLESNLRFDKVIMETKNGVPVIIHIQTCRFREPERRAFIGETGDSHDYKEQIVK